MFTVNPERAYEEVVRCIQRNKVSFLKSSPGMGKSSIYYQIAKDGNLFVLDERLSQATPEDLKGFPKIGERASFVPFDSFPIEGDKIPEGYSGWLLILDELTSANKQVQAAAYKLILDRMVGNHRLHEACAVVAAGNLETDGAVVFKMSTALQSRMVTYRLEVNADDFLKWGVKNGLDYRIQGFLNYFPSKITNFKPDHTDDTYACSRTWEMLSDMIKDEEVTARTGPTAQGCIGYGMATEFITFAEEYAKLPRLSDIFSDPDAIEVPLEASTKFAMVSMLTEHADKDHMESITKYLKKFPVDFQIVFGRTVNTKNEDLRHECEHFSKFSRDLIRYL